ncbi:hypothetical protein SAMN02983003_1166 [Devosia enhydra]|uniref:Uncharacterized protein n=1 Tax=Devosia enhydra TaxID=665118 RepID=A0A1K2HV89_9HYPH|nr:hypothetical protein [Devosia enhydra]SFZ82595.1 hypothetical protein SAMN02983003_1166 [Devosia enhydra]
MRPIGVLAALLALCAPATAGQGLMCEGQDLTVHIPLAGIAGIVPLGAEIEAEGRRWSMDGPPGAALLVAGQSYGTGDAIRIDLRDDDGAEVRVRLRLFSVDGGDAVGGVVEIVGTGAWAVACSFG